MAFSFLQEIIIPSRFILFVVFLYFFSLTNLREKKYRKTTNEMGR
jgi:hypothetical protein